MVYSGDYGEYGVFMPTKSSQPNPSGASKKRCHRLTVDQSALVARERSGDRVVSDPGKERNSRAS